MTTYERIHNTVQAEVWDGTAEALERLARFVGDLQRVQDGKPKVIRGFVNDGTDVLLEFYCARAETDVSLRQGGAVAAERDGTGFYPIAADVLAADFRPVTADEASPTAAHTLEVDDVVVAELVDAADDLEERLTRLEADL